MHITWPLNIKPKPPVSSMGKYSVIVLKRFSWYPETSSDSSPLQTRAAIEMPLTESTYLRSWAVVVRQVLMLLQQLTLARIVTLDQDDRWILARDLDDVSLGQLYHCGNYYLPLAEENELPTDSDWDQTFVQSLAEVHDNGETVLNRPLGNMYRDSAAQEMN